MAGMVSRKSIGQMVETVEVNGVIVPVDAVCVICGGLLNGTSFHIKSPRDSGSLHINFAEKVDPGLWSISNPGDLRKPETWMWAWS